jgi:hypothetical protein
LSGSQKPNNGIFRFAAGYYQGPYTGYCDGNLEAILSPDGTMIIYQPGSLTFDDDAGMAPVAANGSFTIATAKGEHFSGTVNSVSLTISGSFVHGCDGLGFGTFTLTRTEKLN